MNGINRQHSRRYSVALVLAIELALALARELALAPAFALGPALALAQVRRPGAATKSTGYGFSASPAVL